LIPCLKSATRTCPPRRAVSTLCGSCDPPTYRCLHRVFAVKIDVFGNQNIFKDRKNSSRELSSRLAFRFADRSAPQFLAVNQIIFLSMWMSKSGLFPFVRNQP
jgi:hypothetical protein